MNAYILLTQKNVQINNIPPRLMWNIDTNDWGSTTSGYCGETSILSAGLLYGQYVPMYIVRQVLADYFNSLWGGDPTKPSSELKTMWSSYFGTDWDSGSGSPGGDYKKETKKENVPRAWFQDREQYYCQVLPQTGEDSGDATSGFSPINTVLKNLRLAYDHFKVTKENPHQNTKEKFIPWMKGHVINGHPVTIGVQDFLDGSTDTDFDHIVTVIGWGSNNPFTNTQYFADDEIVFSDHGLVICGQQPHGGSIPYYFRYVMETPSSIATTGGWLPDGGCPDPDNPAWSFILDLGSQRSLKFTGGSGEQKTATCNTYQLAQSPSSAGSNGNAGFAITGLSDTSPPGVQVRIDTDCYYQVPCITTAQATSGTMPPGQMINHSIAVSGLDASTSYKVWLFAAKNTAELGKIPTSGFNTYGKSINAQCYHISGQTSFNQIYALAADTALLVRCVKTTDQ